MQLWKRFWQWLRRKPEPPAPPALEIRFIVEHQYPAPTAETAAVGETTWTELPPVAVEEPPEPEVVEEEDEEDPGPPSPMVRPMGAQPILPPQPPVIARVRRQLAGPVKATAIRGFGVRPM